MTTRSPAELEPEIEASRQALAGDVAALKARATPRRMMGDAAVRVRARSRRIGRRLLKSASSDRIWLPVIGGLVVAGAGAFLISELVASRRQPRTPATVLASAAEPIGAALAGAGAWLLTRRRWEARKRAVTALAARAAEPVGPLWRRVSGRKHGLRAFLPMLH